LTGAQVFSADNAMGLLLQHTQTPPVAPSSRSVQPIPPALDRIVLDCLAKEPADRPASAQELSRRLSTVPVSSDWTEQRARDWWNAIAVPAAAVQPA
jgi:serine/threonine-protein kinase